MDAELLPCPFCGGCTQFHSDDSCDGCHYIHCSGCGIMADYSAAVDPENSVKTLKELQRLCAVAWNTRANLPVGVPEGFRVMKPTSAVLRDGERWEIYAPCGSGGIVHKDDVTDWVVCKLLDAMAAAPAAPAAPTVKAGTVSVPVELAKRLANPDEWLANIRKAQEELRALLSSSERGGE